MLVIRMQRVGRSGHAQFRVIVQDSRQSPKSGKFVAHLGSYDPHTKKSQLDKVKAELFIKNGAQPSERAAALLKQEGVKLPDWVKIDNKKSGALRNPDKLRRNRPAGSEEPKPAAEAETVDAADAPTESEAPTEAEATSEEPTETAPEATTPADDTSPEATEETARPEPTEDQPEEPAQEATETDESAKPEPEESTETPPAEADAKD